MQMHYYVNYTNSSDVELLAPQPDTPTRHPSPDGKESSIQ